MTVASTQSYIEYTGDGATQTFAVPFYFILNSDISVTVADSDGNLDELTYGTHFSASGGGNADGGSITLNKAYDSTYTILIYRNPPATQETVYYENGKFPAKSHERALDKLTMLIQRFGWWFDKLALKKPNYLAKYYDAQGNRIANLADPVNVQDGSTKGYTDRADIKAIRVPESSVQPAPNKDGRKNKLLAFNDNGDPIAVLPESGSASDVMIEFAKITGAGLSGFSDDVNYPQGTVGASISQIKEQITQLKQQILRRTIPQLERYMAYMAAGKTVKIACYGDSTTDGTGTTGWTANKVNTDGTAAGENHNAQAPNAWPARLQTLLRDMYNNSNIIVNNAGYSGQRMDNGWAYNNYDAAITNGAYGKCDVVFIDFGLNDTYSSGSQVDNHVLQTLKLLLKIIDLGSLPVLLTSGPDYRTDTDGGDGWDNKEVSRQINQAKISMGKELNIPVIDKASYLKQWLEKNNDGYVWGSVQGDGLHFGDIGHYYQAGVMARFLFGDIIVIPQGGKETVGYMDSRAGALAGRQYATDITGTRFGKNPLYPDAFIAANPGTDLLEMWLWCDGPDTSVIYRSVDNDGQNSMSNTATLYVQGSATAGLSLYNGAPPNAGFGYAALRYTDMPVAICRCQMGLNKVGYLAPLSALGNGLFHGYFDFVDGWKSGLKIYTQPDYRRNNLLSTTGALYHFQSASVTTSPTVLTAVEDEKGANVISWGTKNITTVLNMELSIGMGYGLILMATKGFQDSTKYSEAGLVLYRNAGGLLSLRNYGKNASTGAVTLSSSLVSTSAAYAYSMKELRIDFTRASSGLTVTVYSDWNKSGTLMTLSIPNGSAMNMPRAGVFGGIFMNNSEMGTEGGVNVKTAQVISLP